MVLYGIHCYLCTKKVVHDYEVQTILQLIKNSLQEMLGRTLYFYSVYQYTLKVSIQRWYFFRISHPQGTPVYPYPPSLEVFSMRPCLSTFTCVLISFLDLICDGPFFWWLETKTRFILNEMQFWIFIVFEDKLHYNFCVIQYFWGCCTYIFCSILKKFSKISKNSKSTVESGYNDQRNLCFQLYIQFCNKNS
eukprot:TRINITY_DN3471_c0_g1_i1.p3 TRINITY_DN3471_c0_g1~~TRINITY_DN3471_c0_g1_i1.p3  ORF type:complete len:192 (-),score=-9.08 TRINITY_DN3471_c0_g1_i1:345-920(-)